MAWTAEQLAFKGLFDQDVPRLGQASADSKNLGRWVDVIELKVLSGSAAHAAATKHLDETSTPSLLPGLVVAALIYRSIFDHLRLPRESERRDNPVRGGIDLSDQLDRL
jgi:hypothetical protein